MVVGDGSGYTRSCVCVLIRYFGYKSDPLELSSPWRLGRKVVVLVRPFSDWN